VRLQVVLCHQRRNRLRTIFALFYHLNSRRRRFRFISFRIMPLYRPVRANKELTV
jgi:hypothetical protein